MRRWLAVFTCLGIAFSIAANAELWVITGGRGELPTATAVDTKTLVEIDGNRLVWSYNASSDTDGFVKSVAAIRYEYDCKRRETALRKWTTYSPTTLKVENNGTSDEQFSSTNPDTVGSDVLDFVCAYDIASGKPSNSPLFVKMPGDGLATMVAKARDYFASSAAERAKTTPADKQ